MNLRNGFLIIACIILLFFPVYLLQVAARILFALLLISWVMSMVPRRFMSVHVEAPVARAFLHERTTLRLRICNNSYLPMFNVALKDAVGGLSVEGLNYFVCSIPARSHVILEYKVWSMHRGLYKLGPLMAISADPFGLFPWAQEFSMERLAFIYPHLSPMDLNAFQGTTGGPIQSKHPMYLDTSMVRSIREYRSGDDTRHIHWKASAVHGALMTSEYDRTLTIPFYVVLNLQRQDFGQKRRSYHVERCIEAAAAFIELSGNRNYSLGFATNGKIPAETLKYLGLEGSNELQTFHSSINSGHIIASQLLSILSVIQDQDKAASIVEPFQHLAYNLNPRVLVITPPLKEEDFISIISMAPRGCRMDFWFLEEHLDREGRIDHRSAPPRARINMFKLPEYGEELLNQEAARG